MAERAPVVPAPGAGAVCQDCGATFRQREGAIPSRLCPACCDREEDQWYQQKLAERRARRKTCKDCGKPYHPNGHTRCWACLREAFNREMAAEGVPLRWGKA
jgi:hypothetical protein